MPNPFQSIVKQYLRFSKKDRRATLLLVILILLAMIAHLIVDSIEPKSDYDYAKLFDELIIEDDDMPGSENSFFRFNPNTIDSLALDSLPIPFRIRRNILSYRKAGGRFTEVSQLRKIYGMTDSLFNALEAYVELPVPEPRKTKQAMKPEKVISGYFDPNQAGYEQLLSFGFKRFQANNLLSYREKGGTFQSKTDVLKIYGVDSSFYATIENHIRIQPVADAMEPMSSEMLQIELNSATTDELMRLRGIGAVFAGRIIKYRELLGGYYSVKQLLEVYNFPPETYAAIQDNITADTMLLKTIRINFVEYPELLRHPYLKKEQVQAILDYRSAHGAFQNKEQLQHIPTIDSLTFARMRPYVTCR